MLVSKKTLEAMEHIATTLDNMSLYEHNKNAYDVVMQLREKVNVLRATMFTTQEEN